MERFKRLFSYFFMFLLLLKGVFAKESIVLSSLKKVLIEFGTIIQDPQILIVLMFISILMGTFAMFNGLLRFAFANSHQFRKKEINVISFMISFMASSGLFFLFKEKPTQMIYIFGGTAGLLLVIFISFFIVKLFHDFSKNFVEDSDENKKPIPFYILNALGVLFASGLLVSYSGFIIQKIGGSFNKDFNLINIIYNFSLIIFEIAMWVVLILLIVWILKRNKTEEDELDIEFNNEIRFARERIKKIKTKSKLVDDSLRELDELYLGGIRK